MPTPTKPLFPNMTRRVFAMPLARSTHPKSNYVLLVVFFLGYAIYGMLTIPMMLHQLEQYGAISAHQVLAASSASASDPADNHGDLFDVSLPSQEDVAMEKCMFWKSRYNVVAGQSWGELPENLQREWESIDCDNFIIVPTAECTRFDKGSRTSLPLVSILAGVSTRAVTWRSPKDLALFRYLLPSIVRTVECGFTYNIVLGYDVGDIFYDTDRGRQYLEKWFEQNVHRRLRRVGIQADLILVAVDNKIQKPGPVFNAIARASYKSGAEYMYRVNDDSEFMNPWAYKFVRAIQGMGWPYGVVGPVCKQSNTAILNHDFTHRTHMEIFNQTYYPVELTDWYMDDWISRTYGHRRTKQASSVEILHHTTSQNVRYYVDFYRGQYVEGLVAQGKEAILQCMKTHGLAGPEIDLFRTSTFSNFTIELIV